MVFKFIWQCMQFVFVVKLDSIVVTLLAQITAIIVCADFIVVLNSSDHLLNLFSKPGLAGVFLKLCTRCEF